MIFITTGTRGKPHVVSYGFWRDPTHIWDTIAGGVPCDTMATHTAANSSRAPVPRHVVRSRGAFGSQHSRQTGVRLLSRTDCTKDKAYSLHYNSWLLHQSNDISNGWTVKDETRSLLISERSGKSRRSSTLPVRVMKRLPNDIKNAPTLPSVNEWLSSIGTLLHNQTTSKTQ